MANYVKPSKVDWALKTFIALHGAERAAEHHQKILKIRLDNLTDEQRKEYEQRKIELEREWFQSEFQRALKKVLVK